MDNPSKITEGGVEYSLGKFDGKSVTNDFSKNLDLLECQGQTFVWKKIQNL